VAGCSPCEEKGVTFLGDVQPKADSCNAGSRLDKMHFFDLESGKVVD